MTSNFHTRSNILFKILHVNKGHMRKALYRVTERSLVTFHKSSDHEVYVSTCRNIFHNLALEDWIYTNVEFSENKTLLLLWRNQPCVVIGRHQNPWAECNIAKCALRGVNIARRKSGGGTVFHDLGNLNCTFFTHKKKYNRAMNLNMIAEAIRDTWKLDVTLSDRDDIMLNGYYKISGTAAKLGGKTAYHHCTLLFDVNKEILCELLKTPMWGMQSKATESVPSPVTNLCDHEPSITYNHLLEAVTQQYLKHYDCQGHKMEYVDPTRERQFPGIHHMYKELKAWDWVYGKTPRFSIERTAGFVINGYKCALNLTVSIKKGVVEKLDVTSQDCDTKVCEKTLNAMVCGTPLRQSDITELVVKTDLESLMTKDQVMRAAVTSIQDIVS